MNFMSKYYQLSTDYDQADNLLKQGAKLAVYVHDGCYAETSYGLGRDRNYYEQNNAQFLLPIPDPTIALQHSLKLALNECDELRQKNETLNYDLEIFKSGNRTIMASNERLMVIIEELQSDLDTAKNDLTVADAAIEELEKEKDGLWNTIEKSEIGYTHVWDLLERAEKKVEEFSNGVLERDRTISNLQIQIDGRDAALRGGIKTVQELNQENERLLAVLEDRCNKIDILEDNLDRANSDRLSELTSIMRMVQALDYTSLELRDGAIHLFKRVVYDAICKLDPSQSL
jgi:chromosome segregation ATPase